MPRDHLALALLDDAGGLGLGDDRAEFLLGDGMVAVARLAEQAEDQRARLVERPGERRRHPGQDDHRRGDGAGDRLGRAQRELLGDELAGDQRDIGRDDDDDAEAELRRGVRRQRQERGEALGGRPGEAGPRERAVEDRDEGDADLRRRQEAGRVLGQRQRRRRTGPAGGGEPAQPRPPRRDDGELGHAEKAVERDQREHDNGIDPGVGVHSPPRGGTACAPRSRARLTTIRRGAKPAMRIATGNLYAFMV